MTEEQRRQFDEVSKNCITAFHSFTFGQCDLKESIKLIEIAQDSFEKLKVMMGYYTRQIMKMTSPAPKVYVVRSHMVECYDLWVFAQKNDAVDFVNECPTDDLFMSEHEVTL